MFVVYNNSRLRDLKIDIGSKASLTALNEFCDAKLTL